MSTPCQHLMCSVCFFEWADHWRAEAQRRIDAGDGAVISDALCPSCREPVITFGLLKSMVLPGDNTGGPAPLRLYLAPREPAVKPLTVLDVSVFAVAVGFAYYVVRALIILVRPCTGADFV